MENIPVKPAMHVFVCVNDRSSRPENNMPSCGPAITPAMVKEVKEWIRSQGWTTSIFCTKASCLGFCNADGGVLCIWPQGKYIKSVHSVDDIKKVIVEEAKKMGL